MKLSEKTIEVLKNFSQIQPNLIVQAGSNIKTISEAKNIMASADIDETFENGFGIYDLTEFLSALNLVDNPTLEFTDNAVKIKGGNSTVVYRFANQEILTKPASSVTMPEADLDITISAEDISQIKRAASALGHPVLSLSSEDGVNLEAKVCDPNNPTANTWSKTIANDKFGNSDYQFLIRS
jgi:hypothetical protein